MSGQIEDAVVCECHSASGLRLLRPVGLRAEDRSQNSHQLRRLLDRDRQARRQAALAANLPENR
jgi:hypothetical protein